jgi:tRNA-uridine 2-sulfurtransferase
MTRVVIAMSGGVDSSVAAALLKEQGYDVVGIMLRLWSEPAAREDDCVEHVAENKCCSEESVYDARRVAQKLDIPFYLYNVEEAFRATVVDFFYDEYVAGRTPNPCLRCNRTIRFTVLLERALALGAEYLATGHYVRVDDDPVTGLRRLRRGVDNAKDQSYMLHVLSQEQLRHALFPLGELTKPEVRAIAADRGLPVAAKAESQEICFVAQNDYRGFMKRYANARQLVMAGAAERGEDATPAVAGLRPGPIIALDGKQLGEHQGLANYTIGQRKGLGITSSEPLHVLKLDAEKNALVVGPAKALERDELTVREMSYPRGAIPDAPFSAAVRIRYKAPEIPAMVTPLPGGRAHIALQQPQRAITPGQAAVMYGGDTGDEVLGGGIIE